MNARRAARELALLTLFQLNKQGKPVAADALSDVSLSEMILASVRALADEAKSKIEDAAKDLIQVSDAIRQLEMAHPSNAEAAIDAPIAPVSLDQLGDTEALARQVEQCLLAAEYLMEAQRVPEFAALAATPEVHAYACKLIRLTLTHLNEIDGLINQLSADWRVDRLVAMDAWILRLAAAEMRYSDLVDLSVSIDEAVELAHEFSTEESFKFINGVLGALADQLAPTP